MDQERELELLRRERDFYARLASLAAHEEIPALLDDALGLALDLTRSSLGYLAVRTPADDAPRWDVSRGLGEDQVQNVQDALSRGIIAKTLASGNTIQVAAAHADPRFAGNPSVRRNRIEAVLCAPVATDRPVGLLYLQGRPEPGRYSVDEVEHIERFAQHLAPLMERLLLREQIDGDPTRGLREDLDVADFVGRSEAAAALLRDIRLVSARDIPVLLTGPSGSGKSLIAGLIHRNSPRRDAPFLAVNCAALPDDLLESELFGTVEGAFTGARQREGRFAAAEGGTLFLDEIAEMPVSSQAKLLQVLQDGTYYVVGESRPRHADVRIVAASNQDLERAVEERTFREDLWYRLRVLPIDVPGLERRREDIPLLAQAFVRQATDRHRLSGMELSPLAEAALLAAPWPGEIRELRNTLEAALLRAHGDGASTVSPQHLFPDRDDEADHRPSWQEFTRHAQRDYLERVLQDTGWNVSEAARVLDLSRAHLYNLIRGFGLARDEPSP